MFIYGKFIREQMRQEFSAWCQGKNLELAVIRLGDDPSALFFVKGIQSYIKDLCIRVNVFQFAPITSEERLIKHIQMLNDDPLVTAILLQKPFRRAGMTTGWLILFCRSRTLRVFIPPT